MSVIFGIKENNRIIIAGDKRGSSIDGKTLSDDLDKVLMINDHLAFSSAGNAAIEKAICYMNGNYYSKFEEKMIVGYLEGALKELED